MKEVQLPRPLVVRLLTLAQADHNGLSRGVIGARNGQPDAVKILEGSSEELFAFPQEELHAAITGLAEEGQLFYAVFESRPNAITPTQEDLERIGMRGLLYLVISLGTKGVLEMQGWRLGEKEPEQLQVGIREIS